MSWQLPLDSGCDSAEESATSSALGVPVHGELLGVVRHHGAREQGVHPRDHHARVLEARVPFPARQQMRLRSVFPSSGFAEDLPRQQYHRSARLGEAPLVPDTSG